MFVQVLPFPPALSAHVTYKLRPRWSRERKSSRSAQRLETGGVSVPATHEDHLKLSLSTRSKFGAGLHGYNSRRLLSCAGREVASCHEWVSTFSIPSDLLVEDFDSSVSKCDLSMFFGGSACVVRAIVSHLLEICGDNSETIVPSPPGTVFVNMRQNRPGPQCCHHIALQMGLLRNAGYFKQKKKKRWVLD